jgi:hypothetical protein
MSHDANGDGAGNHSNTLGLTLLGVLVSAGEAIAIDDCCGT